jgi:hypothetical protein
MDEEPRPGGSDPLDAAQPMTAPAAPTATPPPPAGDSQPLVAWDPPSTMPPDDVGSESGPSAPPSTAHRILEAAAWVVGIGGYLVVAWVYAMTYPTDDISSTEAGRFAGSLVGPVLFAVVARWVVVRLRRRGQVLSPWVPVLATLLLFITVVRVPTTQTTAPSNTATSSSPAATSSSRPIGAYLAVEAPYRMEGAAADEAAEFKKSLGRPGLEMEVRRLTRSGTVEGFLVVMDAGALNTAGGMRAFETGIKSQPGVSTERTTIAGRDAVVADIPAEGVGFVAWMEGPTILVVYGQDTDSAGDMAEAVIAAYQ